MALTDRDIWRAFRHHSRTFSLAARLLPSDVQLPVATLYLFCRRVDTVADERVLEVGPDAALQELDAIETDLRAALDGTPPDEPLWTRLADVHARFGLLTPPLFDLLEGARWDLTARPITREADLLRYSDLVGGCVGAMMLPFLVPDRDDVARLEAPARELGIAMQITNILRDVGEDARVLGRSYLPADALAAHGFARAPLAPSPAYARLLETLMTLAEVRFTRGLAAVEALPSASRHGIASAGRMYREILNEIRAADYDNLTRRAVVPLGRKAQLLITDDYEQRKATLLAARAQALQPS